MRSARASELRPLPDRDDRPFTVDFVSTRFHGSKRKLAAWLWSSFGRLTFDTALDLFGGTGAVSHLLKSAGKEVMYNDILRSNFDAAVALIKNRNVTLDEDDVDEILQRRSSLNYPTFIADTFDGIYFTPDENRWLDQTIYNINSLPADEYKRSLALFALYQSCMIKRPYNLFHRANLYMRTADVARSFGNLATWNKPFPYFFKKFVTEANRAVFDNGRNNSAAMVDALDAPTGADLVYIDPPYVSDTKASTDYFGFYHFLEGLSGYDVWPDRVNYGTKHRSIVGPQSAWTNPLMISGELQRVVQRYADSILAISYRDDGIPAVSTICSMLADVGKQVQVIRIAQKYALSTKDMHEVLIVGR